MEDRINPYSFIGMNFYKADAKNIIRTVSEILEITIEDIQSRNRAREIVEARQICMYLIRTTCTKLSLHSIGKIVGGRDHATVIHSCKAVTNLLSYDKAFIDKFNEIMKRMKTVNRSAKIQDPSELTIGKFYEEFVADRCRINSTIFPGKGSKQ